MLTNWEVAAVRERTVEREQRALIGYDADKVHAYISSMQSELRALEKQRTEEHKAYMTKQTGLLNEVNKLKQKASESEEMEKSLKQWIQRNQ
jgi:hypothetical protein